jgi:gas vesicle protein
VTALLLAPQSGEETRAVIKERSIELRDRAAAEAEEAWKRAEEAAKEAAQIFIQAVKIMSIKRDTHK